MRCLPSINHHHVCPCSNPNLGYLVAKVPKRILRSHPNEPTRENRKNGCKQLYVVYRHSLNSLSNPGIGCFGPLSYYFRIFHNPRMTARLQPFIQHLHPGVVHQMRHWQRWDSCTGSFFKGMTWSARLPSELNMDHVKPGSINPGLFKGLAILIVIYHTFGRHQPNLWSGFVNPGLTLSGKPNAINHPITVTTCGSLNIYIIPVFI